MTDYSIGDVGTAGFRLIGRKPLTVAAWGLFIFIFLALPVAMVLATVGPNFADMMHEIKAAAAAGEEPDFHDMARMQSGWFMINPLINLLSIVGRAVLTAAVFRAVLEPKRSAFAYLRLGAQELWIGLVLIVEAILLVTAICVAIIPVAVVAGILGASHEVGAAVAVGFAGGLAILVGMIWLVLRFSMALPLSFVERRFALFESWNFTKGATGNLLLTALLVMVLIILMETALMAIGGAVLFSTGAAVDFDPEVLRRFFDQPVDVWLRTLAPIVLGIALLGSLVASIFNTVAVAPWAAAYQALAKRFTPEPGVAGLSLGA